MQNSGFRHFLMLATVSIGGVLLLVAVGFTLIHFSINSLPGWARPVASVSVTSFYARLLPSLAAGVLLLLNASWFGSGKRNKTTAILVPLAIISTTAVGILAMGIWRMWIPFSALSAGLLIINLADLKRAKERESLTPW